MFKATLAVAAALLAAFALVPVAEADHVGPCWHEYAEAALAFVFVHGSFRQLGSDVGSCLDGTVWYVCHGNPHVTCTLS